MSCHVICPVISRHMSCHVICHVTSYVMSCHVICHVTSYVMSCHVICHVTSYVTSYATSYITYHISYHTRYLISYTISYISYTISYIISYIIPQTRTVLQNPYGYGNSHTFKNQEVKATQQCTTVIWSGAILGFRRIKIIQYHKYNKIAQYKLFSIIKDKTQ